MEKRSVPFAALGGVFEKDDVEDWKLRTGEEVADARTILDGLRGNPLTDAEIAATREFARLTPGTWQEGTERETAEAIVSVFDDFFRALSRSSDSAGPLVKPRPMPAA